MKKNISLALLIAAMGFMTGCYTMGHEYNDAAIKDIKIGQTTESELTSKFGSPDYTTTNSDGSKVYTWSYITGSNFIVASDNKSKSLEVTVFNGKVTNTRTTYSSNYFGDKK